VNGPQPLRDAATPPIDADDDDIVDNPDGLPDDVPNDELKPGEMQAPAGIVADTNVDDPVVGTPFVDDDGIAGG
jgi:hypothetical protein